MEHSSTADTLRTNLILTAGVIVAVMMALLLSQLDSLQMRLPSSPQPLANITPTTATGTALPVVSLPSATPSPRPATATPTPARDAEPSATAIVMLPQCGQVPAGWLPYTVRRGDTLSYLAVNSGATIDEIVQANCLDRNLLISGIQIYLPARPPVRIPCGPPSWWVRYTVQRGDTMFSLARSRGTTVYAIMNANCLNSSYLQAERQIFLPPLPATATPPPTDTPLPTQEPTEEPPATDTPEPADTDTPEPTDTNTPEPPTPTATSMLTFTPPPPASPTPTATSQPPTQTPVPPATHTPSPTATSTTPPTSTATPTPAPTATATTAPTNTPTPLPPPSNTPLPTATSTPAATETVTTTPPA